MYHKHKARPSNWRGPENLKLPWILPKLPHFTVYTLFSWLILKMSSKLENYFFYLKFGTTSTNAIFFNVHVMYIVRNNLLFVIFFSLIIKIFVGMSRFFNVTQYCSISFSKNLHFVGYMHSVGQTLYRVFY